MKVNRFKRTIAAFLAATTAVMAWGTPQCEANFWQERQQAARTLRSNLHDSPTAGDAPLYAQLPTALPDLNRSLPLGPLITQGIPSGALPGRGMEDLPRWISSLATAYGDVNEVYLAADAKDRPLVIHIQDAHDQFDAQKNIARLIESLQNGAAISLVGVEGASGGFDLAPYRDFPRRQFIADAAENFLKSNLIAGPEFAGWTAENEPTLWGLENMGPYMANIQAFKDALPLQAELKNRFRVWHSQLDLLKFHLYSPEMREYDQRRAQQQAGELAIADYVRFLEKFHPENASSRAHDRFPNIALFLQALDLEEGLNFQLVEKERLVLVKQLSETLSPSQMNDLLSKSVLYRTGRLSYGGFHSFLAALCRRNGIDLNLYQQMSRYIRYVLISDRIRGGEILKELSGMEEAARAPWRGDSGFRELFDLAEDVRLVEKLTDFAMSPEDWKAYGERRGEIANIAARLETLSRRTKFHWREEEARPFFPDLAPFENFCARALERNSALVDNLLAKMASSGEKSAVLVAGGFHSEGVTALLKEKRVSYAVITPKIAEIDATANALSALSGEKLPLEKLFTGERITLKSPRFAAVVKSAPGFESFPLGMKTVVALEGAQAMAAHGAPAAEIEAALRKFGFPLIRWIGRLPTLESLALPRTTKAELKLNGRVEETVVWAVRADMKDSPSTLKALETLRRSGQVLMEGETDGLYMAVMAPSITRSETSWLTWLRLAAPWAAGSAVFLTVAIGLMTHSPLPLDFGLNANDSASLLGMTFLFVSPEAKIRIKNFFNGLRENPKRIVGLMWGISAVGKLAYEFSDVWPLFPGLANTAWQYLTEWFQLAPTLGTAYPYLGIALAAMAALAAGRWLIRSLVMAQRQFSEWFDQRSKKTKDAVLFIVEKTQIASVIAGALLILYLIFKDVIVAAGLWASQSLTLPISPSLLYGVALLSVTALVSLSRLAQSRQRIGAAKMPLLSSASSEETNRRAVLVSIQTITLLSLAGTAGVLALDGVFFQWEIIRAAIAIGAAIQPYLGTASTLFLVVVIPAVYFIGMLAKRLGGNLQRFLDIAAEFISRRSTGGALAAMAENMNMPWPAIQAAPAQDIQTQANPSAAPQPERLKNLFHHLAAMRQILDKPAPAESIFDAAMEQITAARLYAELRPEDVNPGSLGDAAFFNLGFGAEALLDMTTELQQRLVNEADGHIRALMAKALEMTGERALDKKQTATLREWRSRKTPLSIDTLNALKEYLKPGDPLLEEIEVALRILRRVEEQAVILRLMALEAEYLFEAMSDIATVRRFSGYFYSYKPWTKGFTLVMEFFTLSAMGMRSATRAGMKSMRTSVARYAEAHNALARIVSQKEPLKTEAFVEQIVKEANGIRAKRRETKSPFASDAAWHSGRRMGIRFYTSAITLLKTYGIFAPALVLTSAALAGTSAVATVAGAAGLAGILHSILFDILLGAGLSITLHWFFIFVSGILYEKVITRFRLRHIWRLEREFSSVYLSPVETRVASDIAAKNLKSYYADVLALAEKPEGRPSLHVFIMRQPVTEKGKNALRKALADSPLWSPDRPYLIMTTGQVNGMAYLDAFNVLTAISRSTVADIRELKIRMKQARFADAIKSLAEIDGIDEDEDLSSAQSRGKYIDTLLRHLRTLDKSAYDYFATKRTNGSEYLLEAAITLMRQPGLAAMAEELAGFPMDKRDANGRLPLEQMDVAFILDHPARNSPLTAETGPLMPVLDETLSRPETLLERGLARAAQAVQRPVGASPSQGCAVFLDLGQPFAGVVPALQSGSVFDIVTVQSHRDQIVDRRSTVVLGDHHQNVVGFVAAQGHDDYDAHISAEIKRLGLAASAQMLPASSGLVRIGYPGDSRVPSFLSRILNVSAIDETSLKFDRDVLATVFRVLMLRKMGTYEGKKAFELARVIKDIKRHFQFSTMVNIMTPTGLRGLASSASGSFTTLPPNTREITIPQRTDDHQKEGRSAVENPAPVLSPRLAHAAAFLRTADGYLVAAAVSAAGIAIAIVFSAQLLAWAGIAAAMILVFIPRLIPPAAIDPTAVRPHEGEAPFSGIPESLTGMGQIWDKAADYLVRLADRVESSQSTLSPEMARISAAVGTPAFAFGLIGYGLVQGTSGFSVYFNISAIIGLLLAGWGAFILFSLYVKKLVRSEYAKAAKEEKEQNPRNDNAPMLSIFPPALLLLLILVPLGFILLWAHQKGYLTKIASSIKQISLANVGAGLRSWITWRTMGLSATIVTLAILGFAMFSNPPPTATPPLTSTAMTQLVAQQYGLTSQAPTYTGTPSPTTAFSYAPATNFTPDPTATPSGTATLAASPDSNAGPEENAPEATTEVSPIQVHTNGTTADRVSVYQDPNLFDDNHNRVGRLAGGHAVTVTGETSVNGQDWFIVSFSVGDQIYTDKFILQSDLGVEDAASSTAAESRPAVTAGNANNRVTVHQDPSLPDDGSNVVGSLAGGHAVKITGSVTIGGKRWHIVSFSAGGLNYNNKYILQENVRPLNKLSAILQSSFAFIFSLIFGRKRLGNFLELEPAIVEKTRLVKSPSTIAKKWADLLSAASKRQGIIAQYFAVRPLPTRKFSVAALSVDIVPSFARYSLYPLPFLAALGLQLPWPVIVFAGLLPLVWAASDTFISPFLHSDTPETGRPVNLATEDRLELAERIGITPEIIEAFRVMANSAVNFTPDLPGLSDAEHQLAAWFSTLTSEQWADLSVWAYEIFGLTFDTAIVDITASVPGEQSVSSAQPGSSFSAVALHAALLTRMMRHVEEKLREHLEAQGKEAAKVDDLPRQLMALQLASAHGNLQLKTILKAITGSTDLADSLGTLADQRAGELRLLPRYVETFLIRRQHALQKQQSLIPEMEIVRILTEMPLRHPNVSAITIRLMPIAPSRLAKEQRNALKQLLEKAKMWPAAGRPDRLSVQQYESLLNFVETARRLAPYLTDRERGKPGFDAALNRLIEAAASVHAEGLSLIAPEGDPSFIRDDLRTLVTLLRTGGEDEVENVSRRVNDHYNSVRALHEPAKPEQAPYSLFYAWNRMINFAIKIGNMIVGWMRIRSTVTVFQLPLKLNAGADGGMEVGWDKLGDDDPRTNSLIQEIRWQLIGLSNNAPGALALFAQVPENHRNSVQNFLRRQFPEVQEAVWKKVFKSLFTRDQVAEGGLLRAKKLSGLVRRANGNLLFPPKINLYTDSGSAWDFTGISVDDIVLFLFNTMGQIVRVQTAVNSAARRAAYLKIQA